MDGFVSGLILLLVVPMVVWDGVSAIRAGFDDAFWARELQDKLETIRSERATWNRLGIVWIPITVLLAAGLSGFSFRLAAEGQPVLAGIGLGAFLLVSIAFVPIIVLMVSVIGAAADQGRIPDWARAGWQASWWVERAFVVGANLAYVAWGVAIVDSGYPAEWAGWVAIVSGGAIAMWATLRDYFFQHMTLLTPLALGAALLLD